MIEIPKTTLHRYLEDPSIIPLDRLQVIAEKLRVTPKFLMGWEEVVKSDFNKFELREESEINIQYLERQNSTRILYQKV